MNAALVSGSATQGLDYGGISQLYEIPAGSTSVSVNVPVISDSRYEFDETYALNISNVVYATPASLSAAGTIVVRLVGLEVSRRGAWAVAHEVDGRVDGWGHFVDQRVWSWDAVRVYAPSRCQLDGASDPLLGVSGRPAHTMGSTA